MPGAPACCGGCNYCRDCVEPPVMHAVISGIGNTPNCSRCSSLNGCEFVSCLHNHCAEYYGDGPDLLLCGSLQSVVWWGLRHNDCTVRLQFTLIVEVDSQSVALDFWRDFPEPPDCWEQNELPLQRIQGLPNPPHCVFSGVTVRIWGTDVRPPHTCGEP